MPSARENDRAGAASQLVECITLLHRGGDPDTLKRVNEWLLAFTRSPVSTRASLDLLNDAQDNAKNIPREVVFFAANLLLDQVSSSQAGFLSEEARREIFQVAYAWALRVAAEGKEEEDKAVTTRVLLVCIASLLRSNEVGGIVVLAKELLSRSLAAFVRYCQFVFEESCSLWATFDQERRNVVFPELIGLERVLLQALHAQVNANFGQCSRQTVLEVLACLQTWTLRRLTHDLEQENARGRSTGVVGLALMKSGIEPVFNWLLACMLQDDCGVSRGAVTALGNLLWTEPPERPWPGEYKRMIKDLGSAEIDAYEWWSNKLRNAGLPSHHIELEEMVTRVQGLVEIAAVLCERHLGCLMTLSHGEMTLDICLIKLLISAVESAFSVDAVEIALDFIEIAPEYIVVVRSINESSSLLLQSNTLLELYRGTVQALAHSYMSSLQSELSEEDQSRLHSRLYDAVIATVNSWSNARLKGFSLDARSIAATMFVSTLCGNQVDHAAATAIVALLAAIAESCEGLEEQLSGSGELANLWIRVLAEIETLPAHWAVRNATCRLISELSPWLCSSTTALVPALSYVVSSLQVDLARKAAAQACLVVSVEINRSGVPVSKLSIHLKELRADGIESEPTKTRSATGVVEMYNLLLSGPMMACCRSPYAVFLTLYKTLSNLFQAAAFERPDNVQEGLRQGLVYLLEPSCQRLKLFYADPNAVPLEEALLHCNIFTEVLISMSMVRLDDVIARTTLEVVHRYWDVVQGLMSSLDTLSHGHTQQIMAQAVIELLQEVMLSGDLEPQAALSVLAFAQEANRRYSQPGSLKVIDRVIGSQHIEREVIVALARSLVGSCLFQGEAVGIPEALQIPQYAAAFFVLWRTIASLYLECISPGVMVHRFEVADLAIGIAFAFLARPQGQQITAFKRALSFIEYIYRKKVNVSVQDAVPVMQMTCFLAARGVALSPLTGLLHVTLRNCVATEQAILALVSTSQFKYSYFNGLESVGTYLEARLCEKLRQRLFVRLQSSWKVKARLGVELSHVKLLLLGSLDPGFYLADAANTTHTDESQIVDIYGD